MNIRPYTQFYKSIFPFIATFSLLGVIGFGMFYGFIFFLTFGLGFGFVGFYTFYKEQWYAYANLGITKWKLVKAAFLYNLLIGIPLFSILFIFISFILGDFSGT